MESSHLPGDALELFGDVVAPWWVAGGWGLDLWLGQQTRPHADLDVAILRADQSRFWGHLRGWDLHLAVAPGVLEPWTSSVVPEPLHAVWCRPTPTSAWAFEILLNDSRGDEWLFRRDHEVRRPLSDLGRFTEESVPFLAPEVILLYKAKNRRANDDKDFETVSPRLPAAARGWLRRSIEQVQPGHAWLERL